jgi:hypothetical protein
MLKLPKPIVRKILYFIDVVTFTQNPLQMLQLMVIGIKDESSDGNACKIRKQIFNSYCDRIIANCIFKKIKEYVKCDESLFEGLIEEKMSQYTGNDVIAMENFIRKKWSIIKGQYILSEQYILKTRPVVYHPIYYNLPSLCNNDNNDNDTCSVCKSYFRNGVCTQVEFFLYDAFMLGFTSVSLPFLHHIINLIELKLLHNKVEDDKKLIFSC